MDINAHKRKLSETIAEAKERAQDARARVKAYSARGKKQRIIVLVGTGAILLVVLGLFFNRAINSETFVAWSCRPTAQNDCKKYEDVLHLWRPYRDKPYNLPGDDE